MSSSRRFAGGRMFWCVVGPLLSILLFVACVVAPAQKPNDSAGQPSPNQSTAREKNKDKNDKDPQDDSGVFSTRDASNLLNELRDGLVSHNPRLVLSAFDRDKMGGYREFEDQIEAFFNRYESFRVYLHIVQSSTDGTKGIVLMDTQLEEIPHDATSPPVRKNGQIRLELERGRKGWKIVDLNPRNFFS